METRDAVDNTVFKLTCGWAPPSLCPLNVSHVMNAPRPSLLSLLFSFHVLLSVQTEVQKKRGYLLALLPGLLYPHAVL